MKDQAENRRISIGICFTLVLMVWCVFGQTLTFDFINCDDNVFVCENPVVINGITWDGICRVLTSISDTFYYPFTVLSFMVDSELYGMNPAGFHFTNVVLHSLSVVLLFFLLCRMTGSLWGSAFLAAIFAIHPIQVEAVAWVTGRKDMLSGVFFMLTLHAYLGYVRKVEGGVFRFWWSGLYWLAFLLFAAGLMAKPMLVTLPCVLLLLDYWPLERLKILSANEKKTFQYFVLLEKVPFFLLSAVFSLIALSATRSAWGLSIQVPELSWRTGNAFVSYLMYIRQMGFPSGLAALYPTSELSAWLIGVSVILMMIISVAVFLLREKKPYLLFGWLWFVGMLLPVSGVFRCLGLSRADRFVYLPQIGFWVMTFWWMRSWAISHYRRLVISSIVLGGLLCLMLQAWVQTGYWRNDFSIWPRSLECTTNNYVVHDIFGTACFDQGLSDEAVSQYRQALQIYPEYSNAHYNLGTTYATLGRFDEAIVHLEKAFLRNPMLFQANFLLCDV